MPLVCEPRAAKLAPRSDHDAKFSMQFSVAAMLVLHKVDIATYSAETIRDARVLVLAQRVVCAPREFPSFPGSFPVSVEIRLREGTVPQADVLHQRGGAANPMPASEVVEKFVDNTTLALGQEQSRHLADAVLELDMLPSLRCALPLGAIAFEE